MRGSNIGLEIFKVLSPVLLAALTWVAAKLGQLINARVRNEYLRGVLTRLDDTVFAVVREVHQVSVDALKSTSPDGKLPPNAGQNVKQAAIAAVKAHLGARGIAELAKVLGLDALGVDRLIGTKIEASVHDIKVQQRVMNGVNHAPSFAPEPAPFVG